MQQNISQLAQLVRYYILTSTTKAGSGHPTSSLSAVDLMSVLFFNGYFRADIDDPAFANNDRLIFSKGHAAPLLYSLYTVAGAIQEDELYTLREFGSRLEGHPTTEFPYAEVATGSLGQGLSIGFGIALNAQYLDKLPYTTYVLLGDSEFAEGSNWEALQLAAQYKLHNLVGILDVNRLGQRGETMYGYDVKQYEKKIESFGWHTIVIDGHNLKQIDKAFQKAQSVKDKPVMIIAKTIKGKGVSFLEDKEDKHGKALTEEELKSALQEMGEVDTALTGTIQKPETLSPFEQPVCAQSTNDVDLTKPIATRKAYGDALVALGAAYPDLVVLDAETSNSTYAETFKATCPDRFFEMFIAEQNMVGAATGLATRGKIPFVSTFAAFFTRAFDQIRVGQYSRSNINFVGSHGGVSIGEDGPSQMGLEDLSMFRSLIGSVVLYPSDYISTTQLVAQMAAAPGVCYMRTTRSATPVLYSQKDEFVIGGSKTLHQSDQDQLTIVAAGITVHEALKAYQEALSDGVHLRIIDAYSVKPIDKETLIQAAEETKAIVVVEDHFAEGGLGEAVMSALAQHAIPVHQLAVTKMPKSGSSEALLEYEEINASAILKKVHEIVS